MPWPVEPVEILMYGLQTAEAHESRWDGLDDDSQEQQFVSNLGAHVNRCWQAARLAKEPHERELLRCLRQREGIYEPEIMRAISDQGGSQIYMLLTQLKCRATEAWINDILWQPGELPFGVEPTSVPTLPDFVHEEVMQRVHQETEQLIGAGVYRTGLDVAKRVEEVETIILSQVRWMAKEKAERMRDHIADIYEEGGWKTEMKDFVSDFVTYPTAFFKGPFTVMAPRLEWITDEMGRWIPNVTKEVVRKFKTCSPFDIYPAPDARSLQDGYLIEVMRLRRKALYNMIGVPGYNEDAIRKVLQEYGDSGYRLMLHNDSERNRLEGREHEEWSNDNTMDTLNFWGECRGRWLLEWGVDPDLIDDEDDDYEANVMMVGQHVIKAVLNPHPLGSRPYSGQSLERVNGKIWGKGIPQLIRDVQNMCNSTARALANNMALASGPMAEVQVDRLAEGEVVDRIYPWRFIQTTESKTGASGSAKAVNFFQPDSNANELMAVYKFYSSLADEYSGIPPYAHGMNVAGGAASTATGLQMLMNSTARGVKEAVAKIDRVIEEATKRTFESVMINDDDVDHLKGDLKIIARGSKALLNREQMNVRRSEFLQIITNDIDNQIIGPEGRRKLLWDMLKGMDMDPSDILPSKDDLAIMLAGVQPEGDGEGGGKEPKKGRETTGSGAVAGGADVAA